MRIRSIKPEFWRSQDVARMDIEDRLLFIGLWSYVDDNGVGEDRVSQVAADLFADDIERDPSETFARVSRGLLKLSEAGSIARYEVSGRSFLRVVNWSKHQRIDKPNKPRFPFENGEISTIFDDSATPSRDSREILAPGTREQRNKGTEEQGNKGTGSRELAVIGPDFEQVWETWPKKTEKDRAEKEYAKHSRTVPDLADAVAVFGRAYSATTEKQFIPSLASWLHRKRWTDELPQPRGGGSRVQQGLSVAEELRRLEGGDAGE
ncbi:hypothetical protein MUN76_15215 [Leucobacter rhizosphaerae]|uniref:Uncharacterized protein n=1 Tax=Leucobacter rhizosphaerae TaxID=2932245 RepID=A0ABY4FVQ6_9MICO|nr:hypothetical protein [Leucobacter rhizosphaerae]UOQ60358.1 hypothetical protein MUN76_15215 [Leucobacter rhizosphaerae]